LSLKLKTMRSFSAVNGWFEHFYFLLHTHLFAIKWIWYNNGTYCWNCTS
jgi:hypothetical protein